MLNNNTAVIEHLPCVMLIRKCCPTSVRKRIDLIEITFNREGSRYLACNDRNAFLLQEKKTKKYHAWSCENVCDALTFLLDNICIPFGTKLYRQVSGIPIGTNCAPLVADLFLFCYESDFI